MRHMREIAEALADFDTVRMRAEDIEALFGEPSLEMHRLLDQIVEAAEERDETIREVWSDNSYIQSQLDDLRDRFERDRSMERCETFRRTLEEIEAFASDALRGAE